MSRKQNQDIPWSRLHPIYSHRESSIYGKVMEGYLGAGKQEKEETARRKKESIVDLSRFIDKKVRVKFQGGREASGILKGYDALINLVLDNAVEYVRDTEDPQKMTEETRQLGLIVARGTAITVVSPNDGIEQIANPFV
ncbi:unnamed protein product [Cercopithifilaria johnstoni]|uniref:U6 snRNA-associated Sm-like protein LSm7 n=1 Tax=Cercopithifilaria johnstoni TaxID=2874296 RepID=A0A8J2M4P6_9BILA|nr:unnamed protein product [Cercopithifilaria johnstoni]